ncbi:natural resistance-associated macrophage protein [Lineolata rhizophorae]|uniref:Natural resistance-associated macrophage protein n=1 Tax=Lineolata rhizophorae TaxID=578093 RepID=A0A6A6P8Y1_9PEZI|nr:natural resistance-associated macrophage protein [Lineolata rhizophorae]
MNCPSRVDDADGSHQGWNQSPARFAADLTTRNDLNHIANARQRRDGAGAADEAEQDGREAIAAPAPAAAAHDGGDLEKSKRTTTAFEEQAAAAPSETRAAPPRSSPSRSNWWRGGDAKPVVMLARRLGRSAKMFAKFIGPGFMVAVAYIDPGNYATDVAAGASFRYRLLFIIMMSNIFAIFLQSLCVKLGSVTGMDLAQNCRAHLPLWLNYVLYLFAEAAIIATDIAEVIGTAIALNLVLNVPLVAGCAISIVDVLIILIFYRPSGSMRMLRAFEVFVMCLVLGVVVCFSIQLSYIKDTSVGEVFRGYLPSSAIVQSKGLYQSCGILGATVMPHSLYLGSGIVQSRLREFDVANGYLPPTPSNDDGDDGGSTLDKYVPSVSAIKSCLSYSIAEMAISLFTYALFVNSSILIVAGASLFSTPGAADADLFHIYDLLAGSLAPAAGTVFALALLLSGTSAGIICTIAGQLVSEGQLRWSVRPWVRRLITRSISITPSIIIAGAVGRQGLSAALEGSQVALSVILPFVSAPLIYFTCRNKFMTVGTGSGGGAAEGAEDGAGRDGSGPGDGALKMRNNWVTTAAAVVIWGIIVVMNVALLVLVGKGIE